MPDPVPHPTFVPFSRDPGAFGDWRTLPRQGRNPHDWSRIGIARVGFVRPWALTIDGQPQLRFWTKRAAERKCAQLRGEVQHGTGIVV